MSESRSPMLAAYHSFWLELTGKGDPLIIPNKVLTGFEAGWNAALKQPCGDELGLYTCRLPQEHTGDHSDQGVVWGRREPIGKYDAKFHAFMCLGKLLDGVLPKGYQLTKDQADSVHGCAKKLATDLLSGDYR